MTTQPDSQPGIFSPGEIDFINSQRLCRLATADANGQPHVTPVAFRYEPSTGTFLIGGHGDFTTRKKWRDAEQNPQVALVFDDIVSLSPWTVRGIEIRGTAELHQSGGTTINPGFGNAILQITPKRIISWGIDSQAYGPPKARSVNR